MPTFDFRNQALHFAVHFFLGFCVSSIYLISFSGELLTGPSTDTDLQLKEFRQIVLEDTKLFLSSEGVKNFRIESIELIKRPQSQFKKRSKINHEDRIVTHISALRKNIQGPRKRADLRKFEKIDVHNSVFDFINSLQGLVIDVRLTAQASHYKKSMVARKLSEWSKKYYHIRPTFILSHQSYVKEERNFPWKLALGMLLIGLGIGMIGWMRPPVHHT